MSGGEELWELEKYEILIFDIWYLIEYAYTWLQDFQKLWK